MGVKLSRKEVDTT